MNWICIDLTFVTLVCLLRHEGPRAFCTFSDLFAESYLADSNSNLQFKLPLFLELLHVFKC